MNKKGCAKFLGTLKALIFAFFMTGVVNRPPANGNNHPYIYIYIYAPPPMPRLPPRKKEGLIKGLLTIIVP